MFVPQFAFLFESADFTEWIVLLAVILIVVGPKRLPEMARKLGHWTETFRRAADEFKRQIMTMDEEVHKQESDYMDYAKGETDPYNDYQDAYPSEGVETPEHEESPKVPEEAPTEPEKTPMEPAETPTEPVAGPETKGEQKP
jgi:sec-independent protein translocase protein TatB